MPRFPNQNKLPLFMFKPLSDFNVMEKFRAETFAATSVSSRLPVILLRKSSHTPLTQEMQVNNTDVVKKFIFRYLSVPLNNGITNIFIN